MPYHWSAPPSGAELARRLAERNAAQGLSVYEFNPSLTIPAVRGPCPGCAIREVRRNRSLRHCHLPAEPRGQRPKPRDTGAYVPEMAARVDNDLNLTDGARRCARKIMEYTYRKNREDRESEITVSYLAKGLGRCERTVQRYLRQLEAAGYIRVYVIPSQRTRMCIGLLIRVLETLLPRHRRKKWPQTRGNPAPTALSQNESQKHLLRPIHRAAWAFYCCEGIYRAYMKTLPPPPPPSSVH